jgi:chromosome segregation ATPase
MASNVAREVHEARALKAAALHNISMMQGASAQLLEELQSKFDAFIAKAAEDVKPVAHQSGDLRGIRGQIQVLQRDMVGLLNQMLANELNINTLGNAIGEVQDELGDARDEWAAWRAEISQDLQALQELAARIPDLDDEAVESLASIRRVAARVSDLEETGFTTDAENRLGKIETWMKSHVKASHSSSSGSASADPMATSKVNVIAEASMHMAVMQQRETNALHQAVDAINSKLDDFKQKYINMMGSVVKVPRLEKEIKKCRDGNKEKVNEMSAAIQDQKDALQDNNTGLRALEINMDAKLNHFRDQIVSNNDYLQGEIARNNQNLEATIVNGDNFILTSMTNANQNVMNTIAVEKQHLMDFITALSTRMDAVERENALLKLSNTSLHFAVEKLQQRLSMMERLNRPDPVVDTDDEF